MKSTIFLTPLVLTAGLAGAPDLFAGDKASFSFGIGFGSGRVRVHAGVSGGGHKRHHIYRYGPRHRRVFGHRSHRVRHVYRGHHGHRHVHRHCSRVPVYSKVWVPPRYERVFTGYDHHGRPRYRTVCVSAGYYRKVVTGYRWACGHG